MYKLELGKMHKKAELDPDDSNKFRTQFRRVCMMFYRNDYIADKDTSMSVVQDSRPAVFSLGG